MPMLEKLTIGEYMVCEKGGLESLFSGLCNGASPHLHTLTFPPSRLHVRGDFITDDDEEDDDEVDVQDGEQTKNELKSSFADMLEAQKIGICAGLKAIPEHALVSSSVVVKMRILRAILPTIEHLFFAEDALEDQDCVHLAALIEREHVLASKLTGLHFHYVFSSSTGAARIFQSMATSSSAFKNLSAFKNVHSLHIGENGLPRDTIQVLTSMLGRNTLPSLEKFGLGNIPLESSDLASLLHSLEQSVCARRLRGLGFSICADGAEILGIATGRVSFPSLEEIFFNESANFGDKGIAYLAQGLQASSRIKLTTLRLANVGMGDAGLEALAGVIRSGALTECRSLLITGTDPLRTVIPLANALRGGGLKKVSEFHLTESPGEKSEPEPLAVAVLAYSLIEHWTALKNVLLPAVGASTMGVIDGIRDGHWSYSPMYFLSVSESWN